MTINTVAFGVYPYLAFLVLLAGSYRALRRDLEAWRSGKAEPCHISKAHPASKFFHLAMIGLLFGHVAGLLVPFRFFEAAGFSPYGKQLVAAVTGGGFGLISLAGLVYYLRRRLTDPEKRATGSRMDLLVLLILAFELLLGLATVPLSIAGADGLQMLAVARWAQGIVTFQGGAELLEGVHWLIKLHVFFGISLFLVVPFSHLTHMWSVPLRMILYPGQIIRDR